LRARDRQRKLIAKIDAALARIEDGTYGYCEETGEPIAIKRLEARPIATLSIEAQERHERVSGSTAMNELGTLSYFARTRFEPSADRVTAYLANGVTLEHAQSMAAHEADERRSQLNEASQSKHLILGVPYARLCRASCAQPP